MVICRFGNWATMPPICIVELLERDKFTPMLVYLLAGLGIFLLAFIVVVCPFLYNRRDTDSDVGDNFPPDYGDNDNQLNKQFDII